MTRAPTSGTRLLVLVPDGACEPIGIAGTSQGLSAIGVSRATSLQRANTPALDMLAVRSTMGRLRTIPPGLPAGSEVGIPALLGLVLDAAPGRGFIEAAAAGIDVPSGHAAWRLDARGALPAPPPELAAALTRALRAHHGPHGGRSCSRDGVWALRGSRFLLVGPAGWGDAAGAHDAPMPVAWHQRLERLAEVAGVDLHAWGRATRPGRWDLPAPTAVVAAASGAAAGVARLSGADLVAPAGATGGVDSDLAAKARAAARLLERGEHALVAVHVGAPDEAAHARDAAGKVTALETFDREVVAPLVEVARATVTAVLVAPDHGCDPATGAHTGGPVPACWILDAGASSATSTSRFTEHHAARHSVCPAPSLVRDLLGRVRRDARLAVDGAHARGVAG